MIWVSNYLKLLEGNNSLLVLPIPSETRHIFQYFMSIEVILYIQSQIQMWKY